MDRHHDAAELLLSARRDPAQRLTALPEALRPRTEEQAYLIQREVIGKIGEIGGWKVGSPGPAADSFNCAPLAAKGILPSPAEVACGDRGIEAEIAVRLGTDLPARDHPYTEAEVLAAIASAHPAIEVLDSRYTDPDAVDPLSNLADSLSHCALVLGPAVPNWQGIDLAHEEVRVLVDGTEIKRRTANPAGNMMRLLLWLANTGARWAGGLKAGQVVTTGSWTGKEFVDPEAEARVRFAHAGEAVVRFVS
ncbi:MAG: fumarylacetoacetate hydrolase family protein [Acetobacteraceae bacterium]|nr:fumarylacetoacetate hydrolase family protein [Acetobacteraceae bacterium]